MQTSIQRGTAESGELCYLATPDLTGPFGDLDVEVRNRTYGKLGRLEGVVVDPAERRVRYLVVDDERFPQRHPHLVPLDAAQVDVEHHALCVEADEIDLMFCKEFDPDKFRRFSLRPR